MDHADLQGIPERRENWAEADYVSGAKCVIRLRSGHVLVADEPAGFAGGAGGDNTGPTPTGFLVAAFAADTPVVIARIARELGIAIDAMTSRVQIAWNPRAIAGASDTPPIPFEAISEVRIRTAASDSELTRIRELHEQRCPMHNLLRRAGCVMIDRWERM